MEKYTWIALACLLCTVMASNAAYKMGHAAGERDSARACQTDGGFTYSRIEYVCEVAK